MILGKHRVCNETKERTAIIRQEEGCKETIDEMRVKAPNPEGVSCLGVLSSLSLLSFPVTSQVKDVLRASVAA